MSNIRKTVVTNCEKQFLIKNLSEHSRLDDRAFDEFRGLKIEFGKDWGSCFVTLGKTCVLAQVSSEIQQPKSSRPSEGILSINIELNSMADPNFEVGRQSDLSVQLNRLLEKCLKDSNAVDLESLCIKMNEKVWALRIDINVINHEGNILDCASIAALASLAHFRRPDVTCDGEEFTIHTYKQRDPIPTVIHHYPVCVTYVVFSAGDFILADPSFLEERVADAFLTVGINSYRELCGLHLGGKADLTPDKILQITNKAAKRAGTVVKEIKEAIEVDIKKREESQSLGFHTTDFKAETSDKVENLSQSLDRWTESGKKKKHKKTKSTEKLQGISSVKNDAILAQDQSICTVSSSDEQDDVMVVDTKTVHPIIANDDPIDLDDSEEERVVVLNADKKTNKKKKKSTSK